MAATNEFMHHLSMAACEWFLMFLMYVEAALAFILTKFAHHCQLQTPCLFCFRFDRVFGDEKPDYYLSHFCNKHQAEVSCLITCDLHHKLSDVKEMCDECFMSTMKRNPKPLLNKNLVRVPSSTGSCSCCKNQWKPKPRSQIKLGLPKVTKQPPLPLITGRAGGRYHRRHCFKKARDKISGTTTPCHVENNNNTNNNIHVDVVDKDALSDSGCVDLKFNSCSGSDSGDSFYEIECENEGLEDYSRIIIHQVERSLSVSNLEPSVPNGIHNESIISSPPSVVSNGSIRLDVKENRPLEVSQEKCSFNQDLHYNDDHNASSSLDKNDGYDSPSTENVGEIKGESEMEKLKRQLEHDQEQLRLLHTELEEERNAAAIAADEAMAMITRLQEEKSALHMEALQYLRMMDEQAEYDMDALDKANDLVTEKDKEIQDLEAELEFFRSQYDDKSIMGNATVVKTNNFKENHVGNGKLDFISSNDSKSTRLSELRVNNLPDIDDERNHILHSISELERKFHQFSNGNSGDNPLKQNETDMGTVENEISDLNDWLEAVESDRDFLEHACNTVQSHVGLEFIEEIAQHLHDLRRVRFDRRCQTAA
ncbi:hypothetical protein E3N88_33858 [Mikania micrantha]|uniref:GTD-binding domain-containing protein n=1 Tax=Mikania micrantha TaxID=192012 RepID=A0A5N6MCW0_9ASTR|nr:hypothetical protein E3N88_33858 [Mikania micrantha]